MKTKLLTLLLAVAASVGTMFAERVQIGDLYYNLDATNHTAVVTCKSYTNYKFNEGWGITTANIPSSVTYKSVSYSVTSIGYGAFYDCSGLTSVTIPNSVTSIGEWAFSYCSGLTSVTIPNSVTSIGFCAFLGCTGLISINVASDNSNYCSVDGVLFNKDKTTLIQYPGGKQGAYTIPNSVTSIGNDAFAGCTGLTSVTIGNSVTSIGMEAFSYCSGLTSVIVENGNTVYDSRNNCNAIIETATNTLIAGCKNTTIPNSVTSIGDEAFLGCTGLTSITISNSVTSIGEGAFDYCTGLTSVTIGNSVTSIGRYAFDGCSSLTSVVWNAKNYSDFASNNTPFYADYCDEYLYIQFDLRPQITSFTFGNEVEHIPAYLCNGMSNLTSIVIPNSVTSIGAGAFADCGGLTSITCKAITPPMLYGSVFGGVDKSIPLYVPTGSVSAYQSADQWKDFTNTGTYITASGTCGAQGDNLTWELSCDSILTISGTGEMANYSYSNAPSVPWYSYKSSIQYVVIGNNVTSIGDWAFYNCTGLTSVTIPNSVSSIGMEAFEGCTGLTSINVASDNSNYCSVDGVLFNKDKTTLIQYPGGKQGAYTIPNSVTSIGEWAFESCISLTSVTIPGSVTSIGYEAFAWCTGLTSVTIPNSVTSIGEWAFEDCTGLTSVTIPNSVTSIGNGAFVYCYCLTSVTCFATRPPQLDYDVFIGVFSFTPCVLYVPAGSVSAYKSADQWKDFTDILPIGAQPADVTTTIVTPSETTADIAWPQVTGADTYTMEIKKNGELICTLTFNAQGQLISIAFAAPSRNNAPQQAQAAGFSFTVTSLDSGTTYSYTMTAKDNNGNVLKTESGSFTTTGDAQGLDEISSSLQGGDRGRLIYRNGQIFILRGEKVYTLQGQEVK